MNSFSEIINPFTIKLFMLVFIFVKIIKSIIYNIYVEQKHTRGG